MILCCWCGILTHFLSMGFDLLIYLCACVRLHKSGLICDADEVRHEGEEKRRKPWRRVIDIHFFIMRYFKNKLNALKKTSTYNFDGLGVQGHQRQLNRFYFLWATVWVSFSFPGKQVGLWAELFWLEAKWKRVWAVKSFGFSSRAAVVYEHVSGTFSRDVWNRVWSLCHSTEADGFLTLCLFSDRWRLRVHTSPWNTGNKATDQSY